MRGSGLGSHFLPPPGRIFSPRLIKLSYQNQALSSHLSLGKLNCCTSGRLCAQLPSGRNLQNKAHSVSLLPRRVRPRWLGVPRPSPGREHKSGLDQPNLTVWL